MTVNAAIYARQSMDKDEGIRRQIDRCRKLVEAKGWTVAVVYEDNETSASKARGAGTGWARMLKDAKEGVFAYVVSVDLDRLLRSIQDLGTLIETGAKAVTVDGELDLSTADGEFRATMLAGIARFETRRKSERQLRANADRIAKGNPVPGRRRYGYDNDNRTPREPEATDVRDIFAAIAAGKSVRSVSLRYARRTGWIREVVRNRSYIGDVKHKGTFYASDLITPLVDVKTFEAANLFLDDPTRKTTPGQKPRHLVSGIATCSECKSVLFYMRDYRCKANSAHPCIKKEIMDKVVLDRVFKMLTEEGAPVTESSARLEGLVREATETERKRTRVQELALVDGTDMDWVKKQLVTLGKKAADISAQVDAERGLDATSGLVERMRADLAHTGDAPGGPVRPKVFEAQARYRFDHFWEALPIEQQRDVVRGAFEIVLAPGRGAGRVSVTRRQLIS